MDVKSEPQTHREVQRYYGEVLESSEDLKTSACCTVVEPDDYVKKALANVHDEVHARYYGCGLALPEKLKGLNVLDLGCGAGRDVYLLSQLVGEQGHVTGVDMTPAQLDVAKGFQEYHREKFGFAESNVEFIEANIEQLDDTSLASGSFDAIVSNCVINLAVDKLAVLKSAWRLLREGGELYFADVYADRRIPPELMEDPVLYGECLSGALYWRDFLHLAREAGFALSILVDSHSIDIEDADVQAKTGDIQFCSATYRLFKVSDQELTIEDYGLQASYLGSVATHPDSIAFGRDLRFEKGATVPISGNLARIMLASRFGDDFRIIGDFSEHLGSFGDLSEQNPFQLMSVAKPSGGCC